MFSGDDLLFAGVDLKPLDKEKAVRDILQVDASKWHWHEYYATNMLPLMTKNAGSISNYQVGEFYWTSFAPDIIIDWFENEVFPWMGEKTRVMILMTKPGIANNEHVDCDEKELGTRQHKFRHVIKGRTGTLYFKTQDGDIAVPDIEKPFIMDGSWPHGMKNDSEEIKLTITAGAPWRGKDSYDNIQTLMKKSSYKFPEDYKKYFKKEG